MLAALVCDIEIPSMVSCTFVLYCTVLCCAVLYRSFSHDVTAAILVYQNSETAAMLVYQENPVGIKNFSYVKTFFCCKKFAYLLTTRVKTIYCTVLYVLFYCIVSYRIVAHRIALHCTALYCLISYCIVWRKICCNNKEIGFIHAHERSRVFNGLHLVSL